MCKGKCSPKYFVNLTIDFIIDLHDLLRVQINVATERKRVQLW